ncbi:DUF5058 family protein [Proteiniborus sp.]|uniref:DUF5058 family protein n=1 Tax=Proteiniborus sp. TaxID=2079015 RepID=UPI003320AAC7
MTSNVSVSTVSNSLGVWICALIAVSVVLVQSILYVRLAFKNAEKVGLSKQQCVKGLRSGIISSIGPSISVFVVVFGMAAVIGGPLTWMRLSMIGSSPTELSAAQVGAQTLGVELGSPDYDLTALATSWWTMSVNGLGWLLVVVLFTHRMEKLRQKIGGGDSKWVSILAAAATLGLFGYLSAPNILVGGGKLAAVLGGALSMAFLSKLSKNINWLKEYALGFALIIGMVAGTIIG